jgi:hypothetical protein
MSSHYPDIDVGGRPRRSWWSILALPILAFVAGLAAMGWLLANWSAAAGYFGVKAPAAARPAEPVAPMRVIIPEQPGVVAPATDPELARRVQLIEQRIGTIDTRARQAVGNADRAEGLLIVFAARRALDRGVGLGYLEGLLRARFGDTQPQAVATVIAASNAPVTLQQLQEGLQRIAPDLAAGRPQESWWNAMKRELSGIITVRRAEGPSSMPSQRLERATQLLEGGQVNIALAELNRLPGRDRATSWFADARRYVAARDALDRLETAALVEPHAGPTQLAAPPVR